MIVYVLLPAFNERDSLSVLIPDIARTLRKYNWTGRICVVDDGSGDDTISLLRSFPQDYDVHLISHEKNRGYGAALATGFLWVIREGKADDIVISLDADCTHSPRYFQDFAVALNRGSDVVTASYSMPGGLTSGVSPLRRLMSIMVNHLFKMIFPLKGIATYTNGFRAYRVGILQSVYGRFKKRLIQENGFAGGTELFLKTCSTGARAREIPFHLEYQNRQKLSKINIPKTIKGYLSLIIRLWPIRHELKNLSTCE